MELVKVDYFLTKKRSEKRLVDEEEALTLKKKVESIISEVASLGYAEKKIKILEKALLGNNSHPSLSVKTSGRKLTRIGSYEPNSTPNFVNINGCEPKLTSIEMELEEALNNDMEILRLKIHLIDRERGIIPEDYDYEEEPEEGWDEYYVIFIEKEHVSVEQFISEMLEFGLSMVYPD